MAFNPCQKCGACCAIYKVLFPSTETDEHAGGFVPLEHTVTFDKHRCAMRGTESFNKRCTALAGTIGERVHCTIYPNRPSACHLFQASWERGGHNAKCDRARTCYGLTPFSDY